MILGLSFSSILRPKVINTGAAITYILYIHRIADLTGFWCIFFLISNLSIHEHSCSRALRFQEAISGRIFLNKDFTI
jgi:hypothetical protein